MCECLEYADGTMYLCVVCADEWRERKMADREYMNNLEAQVSKEQEWKRLFLEMKGAFYILLAQYDKVVKGASDE